MVLFFWDGVFLSLPRLTLVTIPGPSHKTLIHPWFLSFSQIVDQKILCLSKCSENLITSHQLCCTHPWSKLGSSAHLGYCDSLPTCFTASTLAPLQSVSVHKLARVVF
jgi:hypothetical protein